MIKYKRTEVKLCVLDSVSVPREGGGGASHEQTVQDQVRLPDCSETARERVDLRRHWQQLRSHARKF